MKAEIVSVGTEIIIGSTLNTNAQYIAQKLLEIGIDVLFHTTVTDEPELLKDVINVGLERADLLIFTGGLGPTEDDMTKEIVSQTLGLNLIPNSFLENNLKKYFEKTNRSMSSNNIKQTYLPEGSKFLANKIGTAPGVYIEKDNKILILLPGPPREMKLMFNYQVIPLIKQDFIIKTKTINTIGIGESSLEIMLKDIIQEKSDTVVATYAQEGKVDIKIITKGKDIEIVNNNLNKTIEAIDNKVSKYIYSYNDKAIEEIVYEKLIEQNKKIAFCESCTGGLVANMFTKIPGASKVFDRCIVSYSNKSKMEELNVKKETLSRYGAVSEETALEMAEGLLRKTGVDIALSTTGIAGPSGGTPEKPVGLVYIGIATKDDSYVIKANLNGERSSIQRRAALIAFNELRKIL